MLDEFAIKQLYSCIRKANDEIKRKKDFLATMEQANVCLKQWQAQKAQTIYRRAHERQLTQLKRMQAKPASTEPVRSW